MTDYHPDPVTLSIGDTMSLSEAARAANASTATVTRWALRWGIGKQFAPGSPWRISGPALRMIVACDPDALEAFRARRFDSPLVAPYLPKSAQAA